MSNSLDGRRAAVTGGGKGIGRAIALRLAAEGASVALLGRDLIALEETANLCGGTVHRVDMTDAAEVEAVFASVGAVDILVNNAGAAISKPFLDQSFKDWNDMIAINLMATVQASQLVLRAMIAQHRGRIVNIASVAGLKGYRYTAAYCAAKHAVIGLTRALAMEVAQTGVTVNAVCPSFTKTAMFDRAVQAVTSGGGHQDSRKAIQLLTAFNPQNRLIEPEEVAEAVAFLCRDEAGSVTGLALPVAGGEIM